MSAWYDWLVGVVPKTIRKPKKSAYLKVKGHILGLFYNSAKEKEHNEEDIKVEYEQAIDDACKSFRLAGRKRVILILI